MGVSMNGFGLGGGAEQLGYLGQTFLIGLFGIGEVFAIGLGFTGKRGHQIFQSLAHTVSLCGCNR